MPGGTATWSFRATPTTTTRTARSAIVITKADAVVDGDRRDRHLRRPGAWRHGLRPTGVGGEDLTSLPDSRRQVHERARRHRHLELHRRHQLQREAGSVAIVITKADAVIVTGGTFTYDGQAHGATGSAKGVAVKT